MKNYNLLLIVALVLFSLSCDNNDKDISAPEIEVGEYTDMIINYFDTTLIATFNSEVTYNIDLDKNGIDDIQLKSKYYHGAGAGTQKSSVITSLNDNVELYGFHTNDTLFLHRDTVLSQGNIYFNIYEYNTYTCQLIDENDSIQSITPNFSLISLDKEDILSIDDTYHADTITLYNGDTKPSVVDVIYQGDTAIWQYTTYYRACDNLPLDEIKYIGVRLQDESKIGWIKLYLFDSYKVSLLESGMQE
jgi:hypothetical protein